MIAADKISTNFSIFQAEVNLGLIELQLAVNLSLEIAEISAYFIAAERLHVSQMDGLNQHQMNRSRASDGSMRTWA